jgi:formylmethanofuran dehydrogenase subunit C
MTGGSIVIHGNAGDELGLLMRRGLIVVKGNSGEFSAASLIAGTVFVLGKAGARLGAGMKRGTIVAASVTVLPPSLRYACTLRVSFLRHYVAKMQEWKLSVPQFLTEELHCFRGDVLHGGHGEVFIPGE